MKVEGKVETIIFKNSQNSWTVLLLKVNKEYITAVGETDDIEVGDEIELEGEIMTHKVYGEQLKFATYKKILPKTSSALISYISDNVKGVGKKIASRIVNEFGENTVDVIRFSSDKLGGIKGLNNEKIDALSLFFNNEYDKWNTVDFLSDFGISVMISSKIYRMLGGETIKTVKENPYSIIGYVKTLEFNVVDNIAKKLGLPLNSEERIDYGIIYALGQVTEFGHTCIEYDVLVKYASKMLELDEKLIEDSIVRLKINDKINTKIIDDIEYIFRRSFYLAEENIAKEVVTRTRFSYTKDYTNDIKRSSMNNEIELSEEQISAIKTCLNNSISVITGGPGTGKTTIIKCIIDILEMMKKKYILCAPTGRAAKRITETTGKEAKTLHRLLEIVKADDTDIDLLFDLDIKQIEADVVIVDEASMVDTIMMNNLFKGLNSKTSLILVGDVNQLPSVGPGNVLKDIIDSGVVNTVYLKQIYRQSLESDIIINAHRVNEGKYPEFKIKSTDMFFIPTKSIDETVAQISSLLEHRLVSYADIDVLKDLQILTPMKKTQLGTLHLNSLIQELLNPKSNLKNEKQFGERTFREGDKVMQIVNNYDKKFTKDGVSFEGVYNGDIGYITKIDKVEEKFIVEYDDKLIEYSFEEFDQIELAYSVTIHKSQGSEFDYVILPLYTGYQKLFTRNLLYTAMTRAKKMLVIVGSKNIVNFMVDNVESKKRKTGLKNRIIEQL